MDEKSNEILEHIENQRDRLGHNLQELEDKVRSTTDWRTHFEKHPMMMMSLAMGGGLLLSTMLTTRRSSSSPYTGRSSSSGRWSPTSSHVASSSSSSYGTSASSTPTHFSEQKRRAVDALDQIGAALVAFATTKAKEFLSQSLPGFERHLESASGGQQSRQPAGSGWNAQQQASPQQQTSQHASQPSSGTGYGSQTEQNRPGESPTGQRSNVNPQPTPTFPV